MPSPCPKIPSPHTPSSPRPTTTTNSSTVRDVSNLFDPNPLRLFAAIAQENVNNSAPLPEPPHTPSDDDITAEPHRERQQPTTHPADESSLPNAPQHHPHDQTPCSHPQEADSYCVAMALKSLSTSTDKSVRPLAVFVLRMFKKLALLERRFNEYVAQHQRTTPTDSYVVSNKAPDNAAKGEGPSNAHSAGDHPNNDASKENVLGRHQNKETVHNSSDDDRSNRQHGQSRETHFHGQVEHQGGSIFLENGRRTEQISYRFAALNQAVNIAKQASDNEKNGGNEKEHKISSRSDHATEDSPVGTSHMNSETVDLVTAQDNEHICSRKTVDEGRQYHGGTSSAGKPVNETNLDACNWTEAVRKVDTRQNEHATRHATPETMQIREEDRQCVSHLYGRSEQLSAESGSGSFAEGLFRPYPSKRGRPVTGQEGVPTQGEENSATFRVEAAGLQGQVHGPVSSYGSTVAGAAPRWGVKPGDPNWFGGQEGRSAGFKRALRPGSEDSEVEPKKRKRVNWSQKDNERFVALVLGNQHLAEVELRRLIACEFRNSRSHEQCANHLRILRSQQKLPPSKEDQERLQRE